MKKERQLVKLSLIDLNEGQVDWLPKNPRQWTKQDIDNTAASIERDPDFLEDRPLLLIHNGARFVVFGGNLRSQGCKKAGHDIVPAYIYTPETDEDRMTIKRRAILDNGSFGAWDFDALANEWDDLPLTDWGVPVWKTEETFESTIEDEVREAADYEHPKMTFQFNTDEFAFVSDALARIDANKENALLTLLGYESSAEK